LVHVASPRGGPFIFHGVSSAAVASLACPGFCLGLSATSVSNVLPNVSHPGCALASRVVVGISEVVIIAPLTPASRMVVGTSGAIIIASLVGAFVSPGLAVAAGSFLRFPIIVPEVFPDQPGI